MTSLDITGRLVAHMDCDAFYVSVELLRRPDLIGKPVIVAGTGPRAVVTTASYEARKYGVGSAMPAARARRLCPHAVNLPPDHDAYRRKSKDVWGLVTERLHRPLRRVSLDEAYVELTGMLDAEARLRAIVQEVAEQTGITISVGLGDSPLLAKCLSDFDKPQGFTVMSAEQAQRAFALKPVELLPGIGPRTTERLNQMGVATISHLQAASLVMLEERFGARRARELQDKSLFNDDSAVETDRALKSKSCEETFDEDVTDPAVLTDELRRLSAKLAQQLAARDLAGRTVAIKLRFEDFETITRARTLGARTRAEQRIADAALALLDENLPADRAVRLIGVRISGFEDQPAPAVKKKPDAAPRQLELPLSAD